MPNINAALGVAQMESLDTFIEKKRELAAMYKSFFDTKGIHFFSEPEDCYSNYWLNAIILDNKTMRDLFLEFTNSKKVMTRPIWKLMNRLSIFKNSLSIDLTNAEWFEERVVNIPSSYSI
jgi:dTDP-4-amino-4,6-dideoxygalactose transaminase